MPSCAALFRRLAREHDLTPRGVLWVGAPSDADIGALRAAPPPRLLVFEPHQPMSERTRAALAGMPGAEVDRVAIGAFDGPVWLAVGPDGRAGAVTGAAPSGTVEMVKAPGRPLTRRLFQRGIPAGSFDVLWIGDGADAGAVLAGAGDLPATLEAVVLPAAAGEAGRFDTLMFDHGLVRLVRDDPSEPWLYVRSARVRVWERIADDGAHAVTMSDFGRNGRFANQLFQYAHLMLYGLRRNARVETPAWVGETLFARRRPRCEEALPPLPVGGFDMDGYALWTDPDTPVGVDFRGYYQILPHSWRVHHRALLRRLFTPDPALIAPIDAWLAEVCPPGCTLVGLHVRRGDYVTVAQQAPWFTPVPVEWYRDLLAELWPTLKNPVLFVATDDPDDVLAHFADYRPLSAASVPFALEEAAFFPDFHVLSRCHVLAMCNSSFSRMAALLAENQRCFLPSPTAARFEPYDPWAENAFWDRFRSLDENVLTHNRWVAAHLLPSHLRTAPLTGTSLEESGLDEAGRVVLTGLLKDGARVLDTGRDERWARWLTRERPGTVVWRLSEETRRHADRMCQEHGIRHVDLLNFVPEPGDEPPLAVLDGAAGLLRGSRVGVIQFAYGPACREAGVRLGDVYARLVADGYRIYCVGSERLTAIPTWEPALEDFRPALMVGIAERLLRQVLGWPPAGLDIPALCQRFGIAAEGEAGGLLRVGPEDDGLPALRQAEDRLAQVSAVVAAVGFDDRYPIIAPVEEVDAFLAGWGFRRVSCVSPDDPSRGEAFYVRATAGSPVC